MHPFGIAVSARPARDYEAGAVILLELLRRHLGRACLCCCRCIGLACGRRTGHVTIDEQQCEADAFLVCPDRPVRLLFPAEPEHSKKGL